MLSQPLISIIIPLYNSEKFMHSTLESALNQTWKNKEIVIVDDGSTDGSFAIANEFASCKEVKVFTTNNRGASAARNFGFRMSKGDYIQYLDADDLLSVDKIENQIQLLQLSPEKSISCCGWGKFNTSTDEAEFRYQNVWQDMEPIDWLVSAWNGGGMMQTSCWITPRILIEESGPWNEQISVNDDGEFFSRVILKSSGIKFCKNSRVYYRNHNGVRLSQGRDKKAALSLLRSFQCYEKNLIIVEASERTKNAIAANYISFIYQFHVRFPNLVVQAETALKNLGVKKIIKRGNTLFYSFNKVFGFNTTLIINAFFRLIKSFFRFIHIL